MSAGVNPSVLYLKHKGSINVRLGIILNLSTSNQTPHFLKRLAVSLVLFN